MIDSEVTELSTGRVTESVRVATEVAIAKRTSCVAVRVRIRSIRLVT